MESNNYGISEPFNMMPEWSPTLPPLKISWSELKNIIIKKLIMSKSKIELIYLRICQRSYNELVILSILIQSLLPQEMKHLKKNNHLSNLVF